MRLWSLHPSLLDPAGIVALWREGLLAQAVLAGRTRGYRHHPQLERFAQVADPSGAIAAYLREVLAEARRRGYRFDARKVPDLPPPDPMTVTEGQLAWEWEHLQQKLHRRSPDWWRSLGTAPVPVPHPLFRVVAGPVEPWERGVR
ncbi:MAG TPA: pyrimidine dimer DNA glycosylase/endonuclease V [Myxococcota bacterium]|nr:pyrimidine dimer DNA glycosylase/endonuclease V [Myxococcota bacterium]HQK51313.1 pyrimidine dimer DNA glycosylase/endonuclease V [Myxococcota bacterium]